MYIKNIFHGKVALALQAGFIIYEKKDNKPEGLTHMRAQAERNHGGVSEAWVGSALPQRSLRLCGFSHLSISTSDFLQLCGN